MFGDLGLSDTELTLIIEIGLLAAGVIASHILCDTLNNQGYSVLL